MWYIIRKGYMMAWGRISYSTNLNDPFSKHWTIFEYCCGKYLDTFWNYSQVKSENNSHITQFEMSLYMYLKTI